MKKKWLIGSCTLVLAIIILYNLGYHATTKYLSDKFGPNTWVNGVYCTGRTVDDVNQELLEGLTAPSVTVTDLSGEEYVFNLKDADMEFDYSGVLSSFQNRQSSDGWTYSLFDEKLIATGEPGVTYDSDKLKAWWESLDIVKAEAEKPTVIMTLKEDGYSLTSTLDNHLNVNKGLTELENAIQDKQTKVSLVDAECYFDYQMDEEQQKTYDTWEKLTSMEQCGLVYDMGAEKIEFDESLMSTFIAKDAKGMPVKDENGNYYYDLDAADAFMEELCESYHTYGVERELKTSRESGEIVMVKPGNFGTEIDVKTEKAFLREILSDDTLRLSKTVHEPTYVHETSFHGLDDTGGTYIEVDMTEQKIYFYVNYELMISSGVVTGCVRTRHNTPEGSYCIQGKYNNRVLRGPGYASFVRHWMPIYKGIGLHDANWRKESEFGTDIYLKNGSHGCINMPDKTTDVIFDNAPVGTPVFIYKTE